MSRWEFEIEQGGTIVAEGDAPDRDTALREAKHYLAMYGQDGPAKAVVRQSNPHLCPRCKMVFYNCLCSHED